MSERNRRSLSGKTIPPTFTRPAGWHELVAPAQPVKEVDEAQETFTPTPSRRQLRAVVRDAYRRSDRRRRTNARAYVAALRAQPAPSRRDRRAA